MERGDAGVGGGPATNCPHSDSARLGQQRPGCGSRLRRAASSAVQGRATGSDSRSRPSAARRMPSGVLPDCGRLSRQTFISARDNYTGSNLTMQGFGARLRRMSSATQPAAFLRLRSIAQAFRAENSGAWLRFLLAAFGLSLAFGAAIFSTAARDAGNVIATVLLASLALLLAAAVGLGIVPYLLRRVGARRVRDALDFEVTRAGAFYAIVVLLIGIAALNTGNNLLYIIVAVMLSAIGVSGLASAICLRGLQLELKIPEHIFAGAEIAATVCVRNPRKWIPSLSISAIPVDRGKERKRWRWVATTFAVPPWRPPERQWLQLPDRKLRRVTVGVSSGVFHESAYFPLIPP